MNSGSRFFFPFLKQSLEDISPFCGATNTHVLNSISRFGWTWIVFLSWNITQMYGESLGIASCTSEAVN